MYNNIINSNDTSTISINTNGSMRDEDFWFSLGLLGKERIYQAYSDFHIFGFNPLKPDQDWDGKLVKESFFGDSKSYLICFDGHPIVNSFKMKRMDYAKLTEKEYKLELNGGLLGMFTKNYGINYEN